MIKHPTLYSYKFQHTLKVASVVLNFIVLTLAVLVLCGWQFNLVFFRKPFPGLVAMHPLTALCLAITAMALIFFIKRRSTVMVKLLAVFIMLVGLSELLNHLGFLTLRISDLLYYSKTIKDVINQQPNVMAPFTAFNFLLAGIAIVLMAAKSRITLCQYLALIIFFLSLFSLIGYIYGVTSFYSLIAFYPMAIHTAICFIMLALSMLFARSNKGFMLEFINPYGGSRLARQLLPMAILIPIALGFLRLYGEEKGLYNRSFGVVLYSSLTVIIFVGLIWNSMASINKLSFQLSEEKATHQSSHMSDLIMNAALDAIICINKAGEITLWNPRAEHMFGWKKEEVVGKQMAEVIIPVHLREKHEKGMSRYLQTGECSLLNTMIVTTAIDKNGGELKIELAITRLEQSDTEIFCGFIRDITENLKHVYEIEEQNKKLKDIAWTQSHIVRKPVANIIGLMSLLSDRSMDKATTEEIIKFMNISVTELDEIIRDIVDKTAEIENPANFSREG
jgi:PAS domain S-box-containing protein